MKGLVQIKKQGWLGGKHVHLQWLQKNNIARLHYSIQTLEGYLYIKQWTQKKKKNEPMACLTKQLRKQIITT